MNVMDNIKPFLREDANLQEVEEKLNSAMALSSDKVKEWIAKPENKPTFDSIVGKAITTHIEKEKASRAEWEKTRASELLQEAKDTIALENQKTPEMLKIEELERALAEKDNKERVSTLKAALLDVVKDEKLPVISVDPFLNYGENAEAELRKYSDGTKSMIDDLVKKQLADKFGKADMQTGNTPADDTPMSTKDYLESVGVK